MSDITQRDPGDECECLQCVILQMKVRANELALGMGLIKDGEDYPLPIEIEFDYG